MKIKGACKERVSWFGKGSARGRTIEIFYQWSKRREERQLFEQRRKYGNPKTASRFICCKHLGENFIGQGIQRGSRQRKKYHIKDLFCLRCACVTKCIELRWCDDYEKVMEQADKLHKDIYEGDYCEYIWDVRYPWMLWQISLLWYNRVQSGILIKLSQGIYGNLRKT